ncbi:TPA: replication-relaxation family protein [Bacillus pacificus]|nr:replication-relaxation family protein [Bacillus pacificus]
MSNRKPVKQIKNKNLNYDQYRILSVCYNLLYVNREQLQRILGIKNKRTINKKLQHLNEYFDIYKYGSYVYRLNAKGRDILGVKPHKGDTNIEHTLLRNEAWIYYGCPDNWQIERPLEYTYDREKHTIIPDAIFSKGSTPIFVEIDRTMSMKKNMEKLEHYKRVIHIYQKQSNLTPEVVFITESDFRKQRLLDVAKEQGMSSVKAFTIDDIK